jgi:hypothetical protein
LLPCVSEAGVLGRTGARAGRQPTDGLGERAGVESRLDVAEVGTGARATRLVYTSWVKPGALSGVLTSVGLHPTDGSKLN